MNRNKTLFLTQFSILLAIEALFCFTPLGSLPALGPIVATLAMIPVCITGVLLGPKAGTLMGLFAGLFSLTVWTFTPPNPMTAFVFTPFYTLGEFSGNIGSLIICLVPRVLTGTVAGLLYQLIMRRAPGKNVLAFSLAGAAGSLVNTFGVVGGIWLFFGQQYSTVAGEVMYLLVLGTILTNGLPEAVVCAICTSAVCKPVTVMLKRRPA
ncbi:ECF transporter S component [Ruminococcaceae bacterium OttesenSCG-928-D13]|nr:ECF transporter S component [Ruminococcaceae bacterium OttesenSCG-928-D13]